MDSFFLMGARPLVEFSPSMKLHELLDWSAIAGQLTGLYQREISGAGGPQPYSPLGMFKLMLLGQWARPVRCPAGTGLARAPGLHGLHWFRTLGR